MTTRPPRSDLDAAVAGWAAERRGERGPHPDLETWIAYRAGEVDEEERDDLQAHLALCRDCASLVLELASFAGVGAAAVENAAAADASADADADDEAGGVDVEERASELERAASWRALRGVLPRPERRRVFEVPRALAASLLVGTVALAVWGAVAQRSVVALRGEVAALRAPQRNVPIYDLYPDAATRGDDLGTAELARVAPTATVILNVIGELDFADYEVELLDADGGVLWRGAGFAPDPDFGTFTLGLPLAELEEERYRVRLYGVREGGERELIEDYPLAIH